MPRLEGKVVLVTGAGSGIGKATALAFAREEAFLALADVEISRGEDAADEIIAAGGRAVFLKADVCNSEQVKNMIDQVVDTYGRLDCAFNNAGVAGDQTRTADCTEENWDRTIATNLKGVWLCMKYEISQMLKQGGGAIVNTSSVAGLVGLWGWSAYAASKHGVLGLTKSAALEYAKAGVRINAVCPSIVNTPMAESFTGGDPRVQEHILAQQPLGRMGTPEEVAAAVIWLCSEEAAFVTGHALAVDGGFLAR
ncbi:MAG: SDR family oxidoreductase [Deltaproteobacteria bacterium]|nr:MAG: SDR family oxidoreductase [Deltaproteobacteria bacterium]